MTIERSESDSSSKDSYEVDGIDFRTWIESYRECIVAGMDDPAAYESIYKKLSSSLPYKKRTLKDAMAGRTQLEYDINRVRLAVRKCLRNIDEALNNLTDDEAKQSLTTLKQWCTNPNGTASRRRAK